MARAMTLDDFLARIPKVELHCHLLGTVRRATFTELVRRAQAPISDRGAEGGLQNLSD